MGTNIKKMWFRGGRMMKSVHFCCDGHIYYLKNNIWPIVSYRTFFIRQYKEGEIVQVKIRDKNGNDKDFCHAKIKTYRPIKYRDIPKIPLFQQEISKYKRRFHGHEWFFKIVLERTHSIIDKFVK